MEPLKLARSSYPKTPEESVEFAKAKGFSGIEIDAATSFVEAFDEGRIERLRDNAYSAGILLGIHAPYTLNPVERLPRMREANMDYFIKVLEFSEALGASWVNIHLGYCMGIPDNESIYHYLDEASEIIKVLLEKAEDLGVDLSIENTPYTPPSCYFYQFGSTLEEIQYLLEKVDSEALKFCLDIGHANTSDGPLNYIHTLSDRLINVHLHDNNGVKDDHLPLGGGNIRWKELMELLEEKGYDGFFTLELQNDEDYLLSKRYLERLMDLHSKRT